VHPLEDSLCLARSWPQPGLAEVLVAG